MRKSLCARSAKPSEIAEHASWPPVTCAILQQTRKKDQYKNKSRQKGGCPSSQYSASPPFSLQEPLCGSSPSASEEIVCEVTLFARRNRSCKRRRFGVRGPSRYCRSGR